MGDEESACLPLANAVEMAALVDACSLSEVRRS